jgi:hypothetical protein
MSGASHAVFLAGHGNSGIRAAGVDFDEDGLHRACDAILDADRERAGFVYHRATAFEGRTLAARHQRLLASVKNNYCQLLYS